MGQESGSIEVKSDDSLDLKLGSAASVAAGEARAPVDGDAPSIVIGADGADGLELKLSPERTNSSSPSGRSGGDSTSMVDLGEDLMDRTAVISRPSRAPVLAPEGAIGGAAAGLSEEPDSFTFSIEPESLSATPLPEPALISPVGNPVVSEGELLAPDLHSAADLPESASGEAGASVDFEPEVKSRFEHELQEPEFLSGAGRDRELSVMWKALVREFDIQGEWEGFQEAAGHLDQSDRVDLGISYLDMGLYQSALREFEFVRGQDPCHSDAVVPLQAQALIHLGRPFDALAALESVLGDPDLCALPESLLISELRYWAARSCEELGRTVDSVLWYRLVVEADPVHRDALIRLGRLTGARK